MAGSSESTQKNSESSSCSCSSSLLILHNALIVTMDPQSRVFRNGAIVIERDTIKAIGHSNQILTEFSSLSANEEVEVIDLRGQFLLPGFINTHVHTSQQLGRGIADDVDLLTWLHHRIWPYESNMTEEDSYISTLLCGIELIHSGVTCFAEAGGQHVSEMARAVEVLGLRACLTESIMDSGEGLPVHWANRTTQQCIQSQKELYKKHHETADGRIRIWFGIRQIMNATDLLLTETRDTAKELQTGIHMHVAEIPYENQHVANTRGVDHGTVAYLQKINFLGDNLLAAHTVWVNQDEVYSLSKASVKVSHCPAAAMRMLGFAPIREMLDAGVCVSLGTDGAPSNNRMSIVDEMYLASLINKGREVFSKGITDPTALPAETILKMVTINGAKSVIWDKEIGSLEVGKKADMIVVNPSSWSMVPLHDCISSLVYCMRSENIQSVMCNGHWIMKDCRILGMDESEVISMAKHASVQLMKRAGIDIPNRMNILSQRAKPFSLSNFYGPTTARGIQVQPEGKTTTAAARTPTVVQIPVHFVGSESVAALKIQKVFRGFLVRKSVKKIMCIKKEVDEIEARVGRSEEVELIKKDAKERVKVNEILMSLLFKLDSVRGMDSGVRDCRRAVIKKAIALQERVDAIASSSSSAIDLTEIETDKCLQDVMISEESGAQNCDKEDDGGDSEMNAEDVENQEVGGVEACVEKVMLENVEKQKAEDVENQEVGGVEACVEKLMLENFEKQKAEDVENQEVGGVEACVEKVMLENVEKQKAAADIQVDSLMEDNREEMREKNPAFSECVEESVETSQMEEDGIEENDVLEIGGEGRKVGGDDNYRNRELLEKMMEENEKMMKLMTQLCERNEAQTRMLNTLTHRVEQLEKAFICDKIKRKKKRHSA